MSARSQTPRGLVFAALAAIAFWATGCGQQSAVADTETTQTLIAGTDLVTALQNTVDTGRNHVGDKIALRALEDVRVNEVTVVPAGSTINGEVTHIDPAGRIAGGAELTLRFTELVLPGGESYAISVTPIRLHGKGDAGVAVATKGDQIVLPAGGKLRITLNGSVTIPTKSGASS